ncbi:MAG: hypothetical protein HY788_24465 [Deltaproteobacteria bacterium]|nr:hypothetical protein [Deltaproteobacteria bacterium]
MKRTPVQKHASALVKGMIEQAKAIGDIGHPVSKGKLRELFVGNCLKPFLTSQFGIGTGHIINHVGDESPECDIIIYDKRIVTPFIMNQNLGLFPFESVVAVIEVKSTLNSTELTNINKNFASIIEDIYDDSINWYRGYYIDVIDIAPNLRKRIHMQRPLLSVVAFNVKDLKYLHQCH